MAGEERDRACKEGDDRGGLLIAEDLGVGQAGAIVDRDVHTLPAGSAAGHTGGVSLDWRASVTASARDAMPSATCDAPELLDVDMDQLARSLALVALSGLKTKAPELAHPDPREDPRDRRQRHPERLGDLGTREAQPPQRRDRLHPLLLRAVGDRAWRRGPVQQPELALDSITPHPLAGAADADFGGLGRLRPRPRFLHYPPAQLPTPIQTERSISVKVHPVSSLGLSRLGALSHVGVQDGCIF